jgi:hypothetical protein
MSAPSAAGIRTLLHRTLCTEPEHVAPIGFDADEPDFSYHGESIHPDRVGDQCMCGHSDYSQCPDYWGFWAESVACTGDQHHLCDGAGWQTYVGEFQHNTCPCDCHVSGRAVAA